MSVRAKFRVDTVSPKDSEGNIQTVTLSPVTSGSKENERFFILTPRGHIEIGTINKAAADQFEPGKEFYVDFTPA